MLDRNLSVKSAVAAHQNIKERDFWLNKLIDAPAKSIFPYDDKETASGQRSMKTLRTGLPDNLVSALMSICGGNDHALHTLLVSGIVLLLYKYGYRKPESCKDILVGMPIYRQEIKTELLNTTVVLRNRLNSVITFRDLLLQIRETILEAIRHLNYPVEMLPKQLNLPDSGVDFPLFDVAILLESIQEEKYLECINPSIIFAFSKTDEHMEAVVTYNARRYHEKTIREIMTRFISLMTSNLENPDRRLGEIEILSEAEKKQVLYDFNAGDYGKEYVFPGDKTIHRLFEEQVDKTPDNAAVAGCREDPSMGMLTYRELNRRSNRLAHLLRRKGVGPGSIVGIMIEPSLQMIIGILAILKAGSAYLPIGPEYPRERIVSMLSDSSAAFLITKESIIKPLSYIALQGFEGGDLKPFISPPRAQVEDLDSLQIPDRSLIDYEKYRPYIGQAMVKNSITIHMSRGCVYNCAFCFKIWPKKYIIRSAENIFNEILCYYKMGIRRFAFVDDLPNFNLKVSSRVFHLIIEKGLKIHLHFPNGIRGDILTKDYIDLMVKAGAITMDLALETTSPRLQKLIRKNLNLEKLEENIKYITETYPHVILELQIIHGIPTETEEEARASLDFIKNIKWVHFPYIHILNIYPQSDMAEIAKKHGISGKAIKRSADLAYHELPETLPFPESFTRRYQSEFLNEYFLSKERLLTVLPYQMNVLTEDELVQKYNSYLPVEIRSFRQFLDYAGISRDQLDAEFLPDDYGVVPGFNRKLDEHFSQYKVEPEPKALRILLLDLSQYFSHDDRIMYDVVEPPLGLMYVMTHLNCRFGSKINGKIAKSRMDFDGFESLKELIHRFKPEVIGIRTLNFYKDFFHKTISLIRQWGVHVPIIAGGPYATSNYPIMLKDKNIDLAVIGEGEITFGEVIGSILENDRQLPGEKVLSGIPGIAFVKEKDKLLQHRQNRELLLLDRAGDALSPEYAEIPAPPSTGLAYIIYTSGSSGIPKGVMIQHNHLVNQIMGLRNAFGLDASLNYLLLTAFTFDVSVMHIFSPLTTGAKLFLIGEEIRKNGAKLWQFIYEYRIDILNIVPNYMEVLLKSIRENKITLKYLFVGGDIFRPQLYTSLKKTFHIGEIINIYGPTETTVNAAFYRCPHSLPGDTVPIGKPVMNYRAYILDGDLHPVPIGVEGELCISGQGVSRGYLNRPELTAERFFTAKTCKELPGASKGKIYRTGDLCRWLPDGNIEFVGRIDGQVKIRGFRIELGEIENRLRKHEKIKESVVVAKKDDGGEKYLCAYIVPQDAATVDRSPDITTLREFLSQSLPDYMIPTNFIYLDKIPLGSTGKVDRRALPEPVDVSRREDYVAPRDKLEEKLAAIWAEVLNIPDTAMGIDDNFFQLGGHSLKATIMISRVHKELDVKVPLVQIFQTPTIKGLAEYIKEAEPGKYVSIEPVEKMEYYPLSPAQKRLYILQQLDLTSTAYNLPYSVHLDLGKEVRVEKLEGIFRKLIARHESLRTSFEIVEKEEPVQILHHEVDFKIDYYDIRTLLGGLEDEEAGEKVRAMIGDIRRGFSRAFDLSRAPLLRVGLIDAGERDRTLLIDMHHIVTDAISHNVLLEEFKALYGNEKDPLPKLRLQYKDYAHRQIGRENQDSIKQQETYWLQVFSGKLPVLNLPTDYQRPPVQSFEGRIVFFMLDEKETENLKKSAEQGDTTLYMSILAVLNVLFSKLSGQEDIIIGTPIAGRRHSDLEGIVGMFVNTLAMRSFPRGDKTFKEFLKEVKTQTLHAFENQEYQFEELVDKVSIRRDTSRNPVFDVMFSLWSQSEYWEDIPNLNDSGYEHIESTSKFDVSFTVVELGKKLFFNIEYSSHLFKAKTIERMIGYFKKIAASAAARPEQKLADIDLISEEEKKQVIFDFNDTESGYPDNKTLHELFAGCVKRTPDNTALTGPELQTDTGSHPANDNALSMTYNELNQRADHLACLLREKGVLAEMIVGIMMARSVEMVIGILGILKAGAAYMPIDPDYPRERIDFMLKDSAAGILISTENEANKVNEKIDVIKMDVEDITRLAPSADMAPSGLTSTGRVGPANMAYIIYTSGTTGRPKGVIIRHGNVVRLLFNDKFPFDFGRTDVWTLFHSFCFDFSVWEMYGALLYGGQVVVIPKIIARDPGKYLKILKEKNVTVLNQTPSAFYHLIDEELKCPDKGLSLKYVIFGGEALKPGKLKEWEAKYPGVKLVNMFGITETTVHVTFKEVGEEDIRFGISNIGKPIPTLKVYIMDRNLKVLPVGVPGECCVGGDGVGRGYLNRPLLTGEKFIENPYQVGDRLYRSGDLIRWLDSGEMQYLGRIDHQVKIRGFRVELGEIESELLRHKEVIEAVVAVREVVRKEKGNDMSGAEEADRYLCAYFVSGKTLRAPDLRRYLSRVLPDYMIPSYFVQVEKIPLTANGKVDIKALDLYGRQLDSSTSFEAPRNDVEQRIAEVWKEVLHLEKVGIHDNYFDLGGMSFDIIRINKKLREIFQADISVVTMFRYTTIHSLADYLTNEAKEIRDRSAAFARGKQDKMQRLQQRRRGRNE